MVPVVNQEEVPEVLTVNEAAQMLRVDRKTLYSAIRKRKLRGVRRVGRTIRIHRESILKWLREGTGKH